MLKASFKIMRPDSSVWKMLEFYGTRVNHPGKWRVHEFLRSVLNADCDCDLEVERQGLRWRLNPSDFVQKHLFWLGEYEYHDLNILSRWVRRDAVIFDVGANFGYYSIRLASSLNETGHVYSFEPCTATFSRLEENIALNNLGAKITAVQLGFSDREGRASLLEDRTNSGAATISGDDKGEAISLQTLDNFCAQRGVNKVDIMKIDVEGHELPVIKGGETILSRDRPLIMIEFNSEALGRSGCTSKDLASALRALGYDLLVAHRDQLSPLIAFPNNAVMNVFCVPK
jgi:FkbM family methyltransferase